MIDLYQHFMKSENVNHRGNTIPEKPLLATTCHSTWRPKKSLGSWRCLKYKKSVQGTWLSADATEKAKRKCLQRSVTCLSLFNERLSKVPNNIDPKKYLQRRDQEPLLKNTRSRGGNWQVLVQALRASGRSPTLWRSLAKKKSEIARHDSSTGQETRR